MDGLPPRFGSQKSANIASSTSNSTGSMAGSLGNNKNNAASEGMKNVFGASESSNLSEAAVSPYLSTPSSIQTRTTRGLKTSQSVSSPIQSRNTLAGNIVKINEWDDSHVDVSRDNFRFESFFDFLDSPKARRQQSSSSPKRDTFPSSVSTRDGNGTISFDGHASSISKGRHELSIRTFRPFYDNSGSIEHSRNIPSDSSGSRPVLEDKTNLEPARMTQFSAVTSHYTEDKDSNESRLIHGREFASTAQYNQTINALYAGHNVSPSKTFRPMQTKLGFQPLASPTQATPQSSQYLLPGANEAYQKMLAGFSPNYQGNIHIPRNRSADIPASENCSLFLTGLPPATTVRQLLGVIRDTGRVYAMHINHPEPHKGHLTSAAKLIFFERRAAERFYDRHILAGLRIPGRMGYVARVVWNRVRTAAPLLPRHYTRVLMVSGPAAVANPEFLTTYFRSKMDFQVDEVFDGGGNAVGNRRLVEYRFGSFRCQAEAAKMSLAREMADLGVQVWFGLDPCDVRRDVAPVGGARANVQGNMGRGVEGHVAPYEQSWRNGPGATQQHFR